MLKKVMLTTAAAQHSNVTAAIADLKQRTLKKLAGDIARLVYLASTRDYNCGRYYHAGLATHFSEAAAEQALAVCHCEVFDRLLALSIDSLVAELDVYIKALAYPTDVVVQTWTKLEAYRVTIPSVCEPHAAELFLSNLRTALATLQTQREPGSQH